MIKFQAKLFRPIVVYCVLLSLLFPLTLLSQSSLNGYPFNLPLQTPVRTFVNNAAVKPITQSDRLSISPDGHFVNGQGKRIRLAGVNMAYTACFPDSINAINLARRIHELGFNAVSLSGWDITTSVWPQSSLLPWNATTTNNSYAPEQIKRFDWFIFQLKQRGIYVSLTNSMYIPKIGDGYVDADSGGYLWNRIVAQYVDTTYQQLNLQYIKRLLNHVNPYTNTAYKNEPALALTSISRENSLVVYWTVDFQQGATSFVTNRQRQMLRYRYNKYLQAKYGNDNALRSAWTMPVTPTNKFSNNSFEDWIVNPWAITVNTNVANASLRFSDADKVDSSQSIRVRISQAGTSPYDIALYQNFIAVKRGMLYQVKFWAKCNEVSERDIVLYLQRNEGAYDGLGLSKTLKITSEWKEYTEYFIANDDEENTTFRFYIGGTVGDVFFDKGSIREYGLPALKQGESMTNSTVELSSYNDFSSGYLRHAETTEFLTFVMKEYHESFKKMVTDTLQSHILCSGNNTPNFINDIYSNSSLDWTGAYASNGWVRDYNGVTSQWYMNRESATAVSWGGPLFLLSRVKIANKPMVITNFLTPYPSYFMNDMLTYIPSYAAFQDYDAYFIGDMYNDNNTYDSLAQPNAGFWTWQSAYATQAISPIANKMFIDGAIEPGKEIINLSYTDNQRKSIPWQTSGYGMSIYTDYRIPFFRRLQIDSFDAKRPTYLAQNIIPEYNQSEGINFSNVQTDTKQIRWNQTSAWMSVNTPKYIMASGNLSNSIIDFTPITLEQRTTLPYTTVQWASTDTSSPSLSTSQTSVLCLSTRSSNYNALWDGDSSIYKKWGDTYSVIEKSSIRITMRSTYDSLFVFPLDSTGRRTNQKITALKNGARFVIDIDQNVSQTPWFEIEQYKIPTSVENIDNNPNNSVDVSPNPASSSIIVDADQPISLIELYSLIGNVVMRVECNDIQKTFSVDNLNPGVYIIKTTLQNSSIFTKKIVIQK